MSSARVRYMDSSGMEPYPDYKDSGIEWIGEIPEHWDATKLKHSLFKLESGNRESDSNKLDSGIFSIGGEHIRWDGKLTLSPPRYISKQYYNKLNGGKVLDKDVLLVKDGATIGKTTFVNKPSQKFAVNEHVYILRSNEHTSSKYLFYFIMSKTGQEQIQLQKRGAAQPGLNSRFSDIVISSVPPLKEQQAIATFLDRETSRIDALVEKKQQFIELLEERRSALISHAVTKGLDPDVPMKDSGIEWIGEIPQHWDVVKLKRLCKIINGSTPKSSESEYWDGDIVWITPSDLGKVTDSVIHDSSRRITQAGLNSCGTTLCPENSIIVSTRAPIGHIAITKVKTCTNQGCRTLIPEKNVCKSKYIYYYLHTSNNILNSLGQGSTFMELSNHYISNFEVPSPPLQEQQSIADHLNKKTSQIDTLITKTETSIEYLKEYRTALISSAVTGKIDVRGTVND